MNVLTVYCDGGLKGGEAYGSFMIKDGKTHKFKFGKKTSNEAEYLTFLKALKHLIENETDTDIVILIDSQLVLKQVTGTWRCKNKKLNPLCTKAVLLLEKTSKDIVIGWIDNKHMKRILGH